MELQQLANLVDLQVQGPRDQSPVRLLVPALVGFESYGVLSLNWDRDTESWLLIADDQDRRTLEGEEL